MTAQEHAAKQQREEISAHAVAEFGKGNSSDEHLRHHDKGLVLRMIVVGSPARSFKIAASCPETTIPLLGRSVVRAFA